MASWFSRLFASSTQDETDALIQRFVRSGHGRLESISPENVLNELPDGWREVFTAAPEQRTASAIALWRRYVSAEMHRTLGFFDENLAEIRLLRMNDRLCVLYTVSVTIAQPQVPGKLPSQYAKEAKSAPKKVRRYCLGEIPTAPADGNTQWEQLPTSIRDFYAHVHDGFTKFPSLSFGLLPRRDAYCLADEDVDAGAATRKYGIDLRESLTLFSNGGHGRGSVSLTANDPGNDGFVWWDGEAPETGRGFWDLVDEWLANTLGEQ